jgi:hypothetical protein
MMRDAGGKTRKPENPKSRKSEIQKPENQKIRKPENPIFSIWRTALVSESTATSPAFNLFPFFSRQH